MDAAFLKSLHQAYDAYVETFRASDAWSEMMHLKRVHTDCVVGHARAIAAGEGFDAATCALCEAAALLHDTGRYEQLRRYKTFRDADSVDHAVFSHDIVEEKGWLAACDPAERRVVLDAVLFHNRRALPDGIDALTARVAHVVRDADKLDIFRVLEERFATTDWRTDRAAFWNLPVDAPPHPQVVAAVVEGRSVDYRHIASLADFVLVQVGWMGCELHYATTRSLCAARRHLSFRRQILIALGVGGMVDTLCARAAHALNQGGVS